MGALGVANDSFVVFYDQKGLASASRGWWMMGLFGHDQAAVLDGGLPKWLREGRPVESGAPAAVDPHAVPPGFSRRPGCAGIGDMIDNVASQSALVLDARAAATLSRRGARAACRNALRPHPRQPQLALHRVARRRSDACFRLMPLRARLAAAGVDGSRPVVTSCGSGVTATILTLAMTEAGLPAGAVYDGSWTEWGGRSDTPVET